MLKISPRAALLAAAAVFVVQGLAAQETPPPPTRAPAHPPMDLPGVPPADTPDIPPMNAPDATGPNATGPAAGPETPLSPRKPQRITRKNRAEFLASLYDQLKQAADEEAAGRLAKAIERVWRQSGSDTADLLMERAGMAIQVKNLDLAIQILSGITEIAPDYAEAWNQLASVHFLQEDYDKAMRGLRRVLTLEPRHYKAIEGLALILREMGDKKGALRATRRALDIYPTLKSAQQAREELQRDVEGQGI